MIDLGLIQLDTEDKELSNLLNDSLNLDEVSEKPNPTFIATKRILFNLNMNSIKKNLMSF